MVGTKGTEKTTKAISLVSKGEQQNGVNLYTNYFLEDERYLPSE